MRKYFYVRVVGFRGLKDFFNQIPAIRAAYSALDGTIIIFLAKLAEIEAKEALFMSAAKGLPALKHFLKFDSIDYVYPCSGALHLVAGAAGEAEIAAFCDLNRSDLEKENQTDYAIIAKKICAYAVQFAAGLNDEKWPVEKTTTMTEKVTLFDEVIGKKEMAVEVRKTALSNMKALFKEVDELLDETMDKRFEMIKMENPVEYEQYKGLRDIKGIASKPEPETQPK